MTDKPARTQMVDFALAAFQDFPNDFVTATANKLADNMQAEAIAPVLEIVRRWYVDVNDGAGFDAGDLVHDLEQAGYPLPDDEDDES